MFDSIYSTTVTASEFFLMALISLVSGILYSWIVSFRMHSTKRFFTVTALMPFAVATVITFVAGNIGAGVAIGGAFALIRFRSMQGSSDEIAVILIGMAGGIAFGTGYVAYGVIIMLALSVLFFLLSLTSIFEHKKQGEDLLLKVTIPESLEYTDAFDDTFSHYLSYWKNVGVKTTGMGSMFKLSFHIRMKNRAEEKELIDELRTKNGNLEISVLPYTGELNSL